MGNIHAVVHNNNRIKLRAQIYSLCEFSGLERSIESDHKTSRGALPFDGNFKAAIPLCKSQTRRFFNEA